MTTNVIVVNKYNVVTPQSNTHNIIINGGSTVIKSLSPKVVIKTLGRQGPPGTPGKDGVLSAQAFIQSSPATVWVVAHNLGHEPQVDLLSTGGSVMEARILHIDVNVFNVEFTLPVTGKAIYF